MGRLLLQAGVSRCAVRVLLKNNEETVKVAADNDTPRDEPELLSAQKPVSSGVCAAAVCVQQHRQITESKICVFIGHFNFKGLRDTTIIICKQQRGRMELPAQFRLHFCDCILVIWAELEVSILRELLSITPLQSGRHQIILNLFYSRTTAAA